MSERIRGTVHWFDPQRRFGFIIGWDGRRFFAHASDLVDAMVLVTGTRVEFEPTGIRRRWHARHVRQVAPAAPELPDEPTGGAPDLSPALQRRLDRALSQWSVSAPGARA
jgi:cold shock CspA family protein